MSDSTDRSASTVIEILELRVLRLNKELAGAQYREAVALEQEKNGHSRLGKCYSKRVALVKMLQTVLNLRYVDTMTDLEDDIARVLKENEEEK